MYTHSGVCFLSFFVLLSWDGTGCCQAVEVRRGFREMVVSLQAVSTLKVDDFVTFRRNMAKKMGVSETDLASKEIEDWYNKEIVAKDIDYKDPARTSSIKVFLMQALCKLCNITNCTCIRDMCNKPCP